ncbi:MAG: 3'(2'),5'-bisphosphate nucleotidase CysQ [Proteobacteria bacterium]|nr:3'(2'),5'-bisphosphate nucleotidase CysQ [Pseudomonadota bacterium]
MALIDDIVALSQSAGIAILDIYESGDFGTTVKEGGSPLTLADSAADAIIAEGLKRLTPDVPILSEESAAAPYEERKSWTKFWLVDPLDGTREFIKRNGEFTVNIALIENGVPTLGVVYAPVTGVTYLAADGVAYKMVLSPDGDNGSDSVYAQEICVAPYEEGEGVKIATSRSHKGEKLEAFLAKVESRAASTEEGGADEAVELVSMGSSLKLCLVAEGSAHLYPRLGPTMEWDTGAADAVVKAAGGTVTDLQGVPLKYNKEDLHNPQFMVAGAQKYPWEECLD